MTDLRRELEKALKRSRKSKYWLAKESGVALRTVYDYFNKRSDMTGKLLGRLLDALNLELRERR